jgi:hypothetical protein
MFEIAGISKQRQGQIGQSETVGGIERSVNASANITEEIFLIHDNVKKRCLGCLLETAKIALKNNKKKFQYISDDYSIAMYEVGGSEFSEADFGIVIDNSNAITNLEQKLEQLAHAALQNQTLSFSTIMKIFTSSSIAENMKIIEKDEKAIIERKVQEGEQQMKMQEAQQQMLAEMEAKKEQLERDKMALQDKLNERDNDTRLQIAGMNVKPEEVKDDTIELSKVDLEKKKHMDEMVQKTMELAEQKRSNMAKEENDSKKITASNKSKY